MISSLRRNCHSDDWLTRTGWCALISSLKVQRGHEVHPLLFLMRHTIFWCYYKNMEPQQNVTTFFLFHISTCRLHIFWVLGACSQSNTITSTAILLWLTALIFLWNLLAGKPRHHFLGYSNKMTQCVYTSFPRSFVRLRNSSQHIVLLLWYNSIHITTTLGKNIYF